MPDSKKALDYWIAKIEAKGVVVSSNSTHAAHKIDRSEYSGLVLYDDYAPLILLNPADSPARRIFTLAHELTHLLLGSSDGLSKIEFRDDRDTLDANERKCNGIAARIVIDDDILGEEFDKDTDADTAINNLASIFKIDCGAITTRLAELGYIAREAARGLLGTYEQNFPASQDALPSGERTGPHIQTINRCGQLLTRSVLTAYEKGYIQAPEVGDVLEMKLDHLDKLSRKLEFPLHRWIP